MALVDVEAVPVDSKPPAVIVVRISPGNRHDFGALAPSSTIVLSLHIFRRAGGSMDSSSKLARHSGSR